MYFIIIVSAALSLLQFIYIIIGNNFRFLWMQGVDRNGTAPPSLMKSSSSVQIDNDDFLGSHHDDGKPDSGDIDVPTSSSSSLLLSPEEQFNDDDNNTAYGGVFEYILEEVVSDLCLELIDIGGVLNEARRLHRGRATTAPEVLEELMHPDMVSVPMTQLDTEQELIAELKKCNQQKGSKVITLEISGTIFYMSLMHYQGDNLSVPIYNDVKQKRIEFLDFTRRSDDQLLYLWDSRQAIVLSMLNDDNVFESRLFIAMTNLYLPFGDAAGTINQEFVLLDILVRMDPYTYIDALVGLIETGEVRLWKYSKDHLRFLYCDFQFPLQRGEDFWIEKRDEFYNERGLIYDPARRIPRDPDISNLNRIYSINKEYIKEYPRAYVGKGCAAKQRENFEKWRLLPGKNKTTEEENENIISLLNRAKNVHTKKVIDSDVKLAAQMVVEEQKRQANAKRAETRKLNAAAKAAEVAEAIANAKSKGAQVSALSVTSKACEEDEDIIVDSTKSAGGKKRSKSKPSSTAVETTESGDGVKLLSTAQIVTTVPSGPSSAASAQVLTIVIDTSNSTTAASSSTSNSKTVQVAAAADEHVSNLMAAYKIEQAKQVIQREKEIEEMKQKEHAFKVQQHRDSLALTAQQHASNMQNTQRKLDVENLRSQITYDQQSRFYQSLRQQADKNSHHTAMSRESAGAELDIQRDQFNLRKDIQEWDDRRLAKQAQQFRSNVEHDSQVAWQREDALRKQSAQSAWYNAELGNAPRHHRYSQPSVQSGQKQDLRQGLLDVGQKRKRGEDDGDGNGVEDASGDVGSDDEEDFQYISKPFKPKSSSNSRL